MSNKLKVGVVGLGRRGSGFAEEGIGLLGNLLSNDKVVVTYICDSYDERLDFAENNILKAGQNKPVRSKNYKEIFENDVEAVIVSTNWAMHVEVALSCMENKVPVAIEVGGSHNIEDIWKLVDCYERTKTPFMFLENCCYNKDELLVTSLVRKGVLGDISYCEGGYCHDLRRQVTELGITLHHYRFGEYRDYNCENYPTHELGPMIKLLGITRGNRFTRLVSMASKQQGLYEYIKNHKEVSSLKDVVFKQGDVVNTLIQCENGETIMIKLDTTLPRFYDRGFTVCGTKGNYSQTIQSVYLDGDEQKGSFKDSFNNQDKYNDYLPKDWQNISDEQIEMGHGGMDYIMLKYFVNAVINKEEMPIDVYEAASMMCVTCLSEESIKNGSVPIDIPDFTRGKYKDRKIRDVVDL